MYAVIATILLILSICRWIVILWVVASWLIQFGVINRYRRGNALNDFALRVADMLERLTEPALRPIRRMVPLINGVDISPLVLLVILFFLTILIQQDIAPPLLAIGG